MAGLRGNVGWIMGAKQAAKGTTATPATATTWKNALSGGAIGPNRTVNNLSETDSSRDRGISYVSVGGVEGSPEFYARDASIGAYLYWALGGAAVTGSTNLTHTITPATSLPYVSFWRNVGDTLFESYTDCKVGGLHIKADAGQPLVATATIQGRTPKILTADPSTSPAISLDAATAYNYNNATVTLAGGAVSTVKGFEIGIENNLQVQQTDDVIPYDIVEGTREVSLSFDLIFETLAEYNKFHYGSASPTTGTAQVSTIYTTSAVFDFPLGANNAIKFTLPSIAYEEFPVATSAAGDPVTVSVRAVAQRSGSPVLTAEVKNQVVDYTA